MQKKVIGPLKSVIFGKAETAMKTMTKEIWKGVSSLLRKTFQARTQPTKLMEEEQLPEDPLVDVRALLEEMKTTHSGQFEEVETEIAVMQQHLVNMRQTLLLVTFAFTMLVLYAFMFKKRVVLADSSSVSMDL